VNLLLRGKDVIGLPVVTLAGDDVAEVRDLVFDATTGQVLGFSLNDRGGFLRGRSKSALAAADVVAVGPAAVMVASAEALSAKRDAPEPVSHPDASADVTDDAVLTDTGNRLGTVTDVVPLAGPAVSVVGYQLRTESGADGFIPAPAQRSVSGSNLVVPASIEALIRNDLVGLGSAIEAYRGGAS
jgi:uncharacterized protein YrrD